MGRWSAILAIVGFVCGGWRLEVAVGVVGSRRRLLEGIVGSNLWRKEGRVES